MIGKRVSASRATVLFSTLAIHKTGALLHLERDKYRWWFLKYPEVLEELSLIENTDILHLTKRAIIKFEMFKEES